MKKLHVLIGRFEPPHNAHLRLIERAASEADHLIIILGSSFHAPDCKNPFSWEQRAEMISAALPNITNIRYIPIRDNRLDDDEWRDAIIRSVCRFGNAQYGTANYEVTLFGVRKPNDESTWYLDAFPSWKHTRLSSQEFTPMDATKIRDNLFKGLNTWQRFVCGPVKEYLKQWIKTQEFERLQNEYEYIRIQKTHQSRYKWDITFVTADAVVFWRGGVLLVRRGGLMGNGLWALPGGFINAANETCYQSAKREASEETGIELRDEWCVNRNLSNVFDDPKRSLRGRTITHAFMFVIPDSVSVPPVEGNDDAAYACWYPLTDIPGLEERLFEDHIDIIRKLTNQAGIPQPNWRPEISWEE